MNNKSKSSHSCSPPCYFRNEIIFQRLFQDLNLSLLILSSWLLRGCEQNQGLLYCRRKKKSSNFNLSTANTHFFQNSSSHWYKKERISVRGLQKAFFPPNQRVLEAPFLRKMDALFIVWSPLMFKAEKISHSPQKCYCTEHKIGKIGILFVTKTSKFVCLS